jgi:mono/diheme cytochrome c family protein
MAEAGRDGRRHGGRSAARWRGVAVALALGAVVALAVESAQQVTAASGPSLLTRLKTGFDAASFGRAGYVGAPPAGAEPTTPAPADWLANGFDLTGEDLFRINCRSCHGVGAKGLGSDIPSVLAKIRGAAQQAAGGDPSGELSVRHRLLVGGQVMPSMAHLTSAESNLLLGYLGTIAGTASEPATATVHVPAIHVGEHVVKAVCQICHDAAPGRVRPPSDQALSAISEFPVKYSVAQFVHRVVRGSATTPAPGHKPRLDYLRPEEIEAAYVYLIGFPPEGTHY